MQLQPFGAILFPLVPGVPLAPNVVRVRVDGQSHGKRCGRAGHEILLLRVLALLVAGVTFEERTALDVSRRVLQPVLRLRGDDEMMAFARHRRTVRQEGPPGLLAAALATLTTPLAHNLRRRMRLRATASAADQGEPYIPTMRAEVIGHLKSCMTDIDIHFGVRMAETMYAYQSYMVSKLLIICKQIVSLSVVGRLENHIREHS